MTRWLFAMLFVAACTSGGLDNGKSGGSSTSGSHGDGSSGSPSIDGSSGDGSSGGPSGVADGGVLDAAPTPVTGAFPCGTGTCSLNQVCYQDCNAAPTCMNISSQNDICSSFGPNAAFHCTAGGSCDPNTHMIMCSCPT